MRCTQCDLPLSPTNTAGVCPRCHMPTRAGVQLPFPAPQQTPYPQPGQIWPPTAPTPSIPSLPSLPSSSSTPTPASLLTPLPAFSSPQLSTKEPPWESQPLLQAPTMRKHKTRTGTSNLGFIIAAACVITGGLLLVIVYFIAAGLPPSVVQTQSITAAKHANTGTRHGTATAVAPTPTRKTTPTASPASFPAQQYITNPLMASAVNMTTAQAIQPATTFRVGQRVFVTFTLHPAGHSGAVCLLWYSNANAFSHFEFAVSSNSTVAYSYTYYAVSGPAYVELYWASDISCSDKMLAQRVNFTIVD